MGHDGSEEMLLRRRRRLELENDFKQKHPPPPRNGKTGSFIKIFAKLTDIGTIAHNFETLINQPLEND